MPDMVALMGILEKGDKKPVQSVRHINQAFYGVALVTTTCLFCGLVPSSNFGAPKILGSKNEIVLTIIWSHLWGKSNGPHTCPLPHNGEPLTVPHLISA